MSRGGPPAVDFISHYGIVVACLIVLIGILVFSGVLVPSGAQPSECSTSGTFVCTDSAIVRSREGGDATLQFTLRNTNEKEATILMTGEGAPHAIASAYGEGVCRVVGDVPNVLPSETITFSCSMSPEGAAGGFPAIGEKVRAVVTLRYQEKAAPWSEPLSIEIVNALQ